MSAPTHMRAGGQWSFALCRASELRSKLLGVRWKHTSKAERVTCKACLARMKGAGQ